MTDDSGSWLGLPPDIAPFVRAGVVLGVGAGGFFDGIVFHQILQVHHMLSAHPDPAVARDLRVNVLADGLFHAVTYIATVAGVALLWRAHRDPVVPPSGRVLVGSVVLGWGGFNLVEGVLNHHLLTLHHVWPAGPGPVVLWDLSFLAWGALFVVVGYAVIRRASAGERVDAR